MAKGLYKKWLEKENLVLIQGWKRNGLTDEQIAQNIGVRRETLYEWKKRFPNIANALKVGKEQANFIVEGELFKKAIHGNTTAMIFWLKNNWRDKYNDSELSPEERKLALKRAEKLDSEIELAKLNVKDMKQQLEQLDGTDDSENVDNLENAVEKGLVDLYGNDDEIET